MKLPPSANPGSYQPYILWQRNEKEMRSANLLFLRRRTLYRLLGQDINQCKNATLEAGYMDTQTTAWEEFHQALELAGAHLRVWQPEGIRSQSVLAPAPRKFFQALYCTFGRAWSDCCYHLREQSWRIKT